MKYFKKLLFIIVLMLPIFVKAITYTDYNNSISSVNNYINKYSDRNKYLVFDNIPYEFRNNSYLATGKTLWTTSNPKYWYVANNTSNPKLHKAYAVYCKKCGMSLDYYKFTLNNSSSKPSRVSEPCPNGPTESSDWSNWIRVDDSSLDSWEDVRRHSSGRFKQIDMKSGTYSCNI